MEPEVYPKPKRPGPDLSRRWLVQCNDLVGEFCRFSMERSFRTWLMARLWAWYMWHLGSYHGGTITINDQHGRGD